VALVTGSGRGLGRMIAETLIGMGANVALHDISENAPAQYGEAPSLTAVAEKLSVGGSRIIGVTGDITQEDAVAAMVKRVQEELGPISILVNCSRELRRRGYWCSWAEAKSEWSARRISCGCGCRFPAQFYGHAADVPRGLSWHGRHE
jgi:NAD(P)-dependent dehydrogenase (short-subunit alcohol dehydrogenase family)